MVIVIYLSGSACLWSSKPETAPGKWVAVGCVPKGNPTNLDPKRVSEAFQEEGVLVARLCRGPVKPWNDQ